MGYVLREGGIINVPASNDISDTLLVIGSALEGPDGVPIPINSLEDAILTFGPLTFDSRYPAPPGYAAGSYSGNTLVRDIEAAFAAGCNRVIAVRVGGEYATSSIPFAAGSDLGGDYSVWNNLHVLRIRGLFKGAQYNGTQLVIEPSTNNTVNVSVVQVNSRGSTVQITGLAKTTKVGALMALINNHARNLSLVLEINRDVSLPSGKRLEDILDLPIGGLMALGNGQRVASDYTLTGGEYGIKQEATGASYKRIYRWLTDPTTGVFANLDGVAADYVLLSALYADDAVAEDEAGNVDPSVSVLHDFARFVAKLSELYPCHGIIGLQPLYATTAQELRQLVTTSYLPGPTAETSVGVADLHARRIRFGYFLTWGAQVDAVDGIGLDYGRYVSVVAGLPAVMNSRSLRRYTDTPHACYAGMLTLLMPNEIPAFRTPLGIVGMAGPRLPRDLVDTLTSGLPYGDSVGGALVVIERNVALNNDLMVISDVTAAQRSSVFSWLSNVRIANVATRAVQLALRPFLGKPNTADTLAAMASVVRSILDRLSSTGALLGGEGIGYRFSLEPAGTGLQMTQVRVVIDMRPAAFIRAITVEVTVRP